MEIIKQGYVCDECRKANIRAPCFFFSENPQVIPPKCKRAEATWEEAEIRIRCGRCKNR